MASTIDVAHQQRISDHSWKIDFGRLIQLATPASERRAWLAACRQVGVTIKPNEGGRHAFGTHTAARGLGDVRLQKYMGHADPRSTSRYITLAGEGLADVVKLTHGQQADSSLNASKKDKQ